MSIPYLVKFRHCNHFYNTKGAEIKLYPARKPLNTSAQTPEPSSQIRAKMQRWRQQHATDLRIRSLGLCLIV